MDLENTNCDEVIHNRFKRCEFCGKELRPVGFDYLYVNISEDSIEYERCDCSKSKEYWQEIDNKEFEQQKRNRIRDIINTIYKQNYIERKLQEMNLENFYFDSIFWLVLPGGVWYTNPTKPKGAYHDQTTDCDFFGRAGRADLSCLRAGGDCPRYHGDDAGPGV